MDADKKGPAEPVRFPNRIQCSLRSRSAVLFIRIGVNRHLWTKVGGQRFLVDPTIPMRNGLRTRSMPPAMKQRPLPVPCQAAFLYCLLALALLSYGCQRSETHSTPRKFKVALVMKSLANEFFSTMADGAKMHQAANAASYELIVNGIKNETDLAEQVNLVEQMIARQVNAIVVAPADSKALVTVLKRAKEAGVLVVNIDNKLDADVLKQAGLTVPFVGPDNRAGARKVGEALAKELKPGDPVAIIEGIPTAFNGQQRRLGFEDAMKAAGMNLVAVQSGQWEMERANNVAAALLSEHPDLKAILCANDNMALGAVAAIQAAGRNGKVRVVGFDNIGAIRPMVADGRVAATADQHADRLAVYGIEAALRILKGETPPADLTTTVDLITK
jgi:ribose transport system substrate-binding protein